MIVFTDLDGTLLDRETYSYAQAEPAMAHLRARGIPLVLVTSKTRAEVSALRAAMGNVDPYIVENGAAIVVPGRGDTILGATAEAAREALRRASADSGVKVRGFGEMEESEICERSGLRPEVARLAARREFGEPFVILDGDPGAIEQALLQQGFQMTRGGRFYHVLGGSNKARAVRVLAEMLGETDTIGLGDAPNDIEFLREVSRPVIVPSPHLEAMRAALPEAIVAPAPGPAGWNRVILDLVP